MLNQAPVDGASASEPGNSGAAPAAKQGCVGAPDDVKINVIDALNKALEQIRAGTTQSGDDGGKVRDDLAARKATRLAEMVQRLNGLADRIEAKADEFSALPGSASAVELATANVATAREQLALASSPDDLRAVFVLLRDAKIALHRFEEAFATTTTTTT